MGQGEGQGQGQGPGGKAQARFATLFLPLFFQEVPLAFSCHPSWAVCYLPILPPHPHPHPHPTSQTCPVLAAHPILGLLTISVCFWLM